MTSKILLTTLALALAGCAGTPAQVADGDDFGSVATDTIRAHVRAVRDHLRAERQAVRNALAGPGQPVARVIGKVPAEAPDAWSRADDARGPAIAASEAPSRDGRGHPARSPLVPSLQMDVGTDEMLTADGALHPRAARALAKMDGMARDHGGEFTVAVPRSRIHTAAAIRAVAPGATILSAEDERYRLIVLSGER